MPSSRRHFASLFISVMTFLNLACTSNPFFKDDKIETTTLTGKIVPEDETDPADVYVWIEGFNLGTFTDRAGSFTLRLPSPEAAGLGKNFSGLVAIYFYLANYQIDSTLIIFVNDHLDRDQSGIDEDGNFFRTFALKKLVDIETALDPSAIDLHGNHYVRVYVTLKAIHTTVLIGLLRELLRWPQTGFVRTGLIIQGIEQLDDTLRFIDRPVSFLWNEVLFPDIEQTWTYDIEIDTLGFVAGKYRVFPYLLIRQDGIPEKLKTSLAPQVEEFTADYLKLPIKRTDAILEIKSR